MTYIIILTTWIDKSLDTTKPRWWFLGFPSLMFLSMLATTYLPATL